MESDINSSSSATSLAWYCVRSQPRRERLATSTLRQKYHLEVCYPTIRYPRNSNHRGRNTEPLFPGYFFAQFNAHEFTRKVKYAQGVSHLVSHGERLIKVRPNVIQEVKAITQNDIIDLEVELPAIGAKVNIMRGIFMGERGELNKILPAKQRVEVLLKILGQESAIELPITHIELGFRNPQFNPN